LCSYCKASQRWLLTKKRSNCPQECVQVFPLRQLPISWSIEPTMTFFSWRSAIVPPATRVPIQMMISKPCSAQMVCGNSSTRMDGHIEMVDRGRLRRRCATVAEIGVVYAEKLDSAVLMVQAAEDGMRCDASGSLNGWREGWVFIQGPARSRCRYNF